MWMKTVGLLLVISSGAGLGFIMAGRYEERTRQIRHLLGCLGSLESQIAYVAVPLPEAVSRAAQGVEGPVREFCERWSRELKAQGWLTPDQAMEKAMADTGHRLALAKPERELFAMLGAQLGATGREEQKKYLALVAAELRRLEEDAAASQLRNVRMCRCVGLCGGLAAAIVLI